ncbi:MAG: hypothetical protein JHC33_08470 [Ignisphaera sp.]|nr:hypothetical protein [Ignisphaera sp.]
MQYSKEFLLSLSNQTSRPPRIFRRRIYYFNLINKANLNCKHPTISDSSALCFKSNNVTPYSSNLHNTENVSNPTHVSESKLSFNNLSFSYVNVRSINKKSIIINDLISSNKLDFLALTETWHESSQSPSLISSTPVGYTFLDISRPPNHPLSSKHSSYGGVCIIYRNSFCSSFDSNIKYSSFECLLAIFKSTSFKIALIVIYRPPSSSCSLFIDEFYNLVEYVYSLSIPFFILGDFNIQFNKANIYVSKLENIFDTFNLKQHIISATHTLGNTIDLVLTSSLTKIISLSVTPVVFSDHFLISFSYPLNYSVNNTTVQAFKRNWKNFDPDLFTKLFDYFSFDCFDDVDDFVYFFNNSISCILDIILPLQTFHHRLLSKRAPWFDCECIKLKRISRKFERSFRSKPSSLSHSQYISALNNYKSILFSKHCQYLRTSIISASSSKHRWTILNRLLHKNLPPPLSFSAQDYHNYIAEKLDITRANFNYKHSDQSDISFVSDNSFKLEYFNPISYSDLVSIINGMSSSSCSLDVIPTHLLKTLSHILYPVILKIVNLSLSTSKFPSQYKSSIIVPTLKNSTLDPASLSSYRPISNLSFISKIIEKVVFKQTYLYLQSNSLLPVFQSGFRIGHNTESSLLKLYNDLILSFDRNLVSVLVCLDYSSAFDTVDHLLLLSVLENKYNIKKSSYNWFKSYLFDRTYYVSLDNLSSKPSILQCGVPQGSILGPLLFIMYTSELSNIISTFNFNSLSYADDSHLYCSFDVSSYDSVMSSISNCLVAIESWSSSMSLKLNPSKFELIYFDRLGKLNSNPCVFSNYTIDPSQSVRSLGFVLDSKLSLSNQILSVAKSCYFHLRRIRQLTLYLDDPSLHLLVSSLVLSRLDYCNSLYSGLPESTLKPLNKVFNCAVRLVSRTSYFSHISPSLINLHWLPIRYRIIFKLCTIMFKLKNLISPDYLKSLIKSPLRSNLRSSSSFHYQLPSINHIFAKRSFSFAGPYSWNSLPPHLTCCNSLLSFRKELKTFLFKKFLDEIT